MCVREREREREVWSARGCGVECAVSSEKRVGREREEPGARLVLPYVRRSPPVRANEATTAGGSAI